MVGMLLFTAAGTYAAAVAIAAAAMPTGGTREQPREPVRPRHSATPTPVEVHVDFLPRAAAARDAACPGPPVTLWA